MSDKKRGTIKESFATAFNTSSGETSAAGVGVSVPKDVWETFLTEIASRGINVEIAADGPQITEIKIVNKNG